MIGTLSWHKRNSREHKKQAEQHGAIISDHNIAGPRDAQGLC